MLCIIVMHIIKFNMYIFYFYWWFCWGRKVLILFWFFKIIFFHLIKDLQPFHSLFLRPSIQLWIHSFVLCSFLSCPQLETFLFFFFYDPFTIQKSFMFIHKIWPCTTIYLFDHLFLITYRNILTLFMNHCPFKHLERCLYTNPRVSVILALCG